MSTPVGQAPTGFNLDAVRTGRPVASGGVARWADEAAHVNGHLLHKTGEVIIHPRPAGRTTIEGLTHKVWVPWTRSPGALVARIAVEIQDTDEIDDSQTLLVALPTGASWIDAGGLDGTRTWYNPPRGRTTPRELVGWVDVSGCTVGALTDDFCVTATPTAKGAGVKRVAVHEAPLATLAIDATEPGFDAASARAGRLVIDGGASSPRGTQRLWHVLDKGRAGFRQHFAVSGIESSDATGASATPHWSREANTYGAIDWLLSAGATDPSWYLALRDLYAGTASPWAFRVRYRTSDATTCGVKLYHQGGAITSGAWAGAGAETSTTLSLPGTSGSWAWATAVAASLPVDGTDGLCRLRFEAKGPGSGQLLSLACFDLRENES
jgi:hypothetical protein